MTWILRCAKYRVELATDALSVCGSLPAGPWSQPDSSDATSARDFYRLNALGEAHEWPGTQENTMQFRGRDRRDVKRKVLTYWTSHSRTLGLSLREFLANCRMGPNEQTITFVQPQS